MTSVCIIIPSLNRQKELLRTICCPQTRLPYRLVINQSTYSGFVECIPNPCAKWFIGYHVPLERGAANARNLGMSHLPDGIDYVSFWDDDDYPSLRYVEVLAGLLDANPDCGIAACQTKHEGRILPWWHANTYSRMVRRELLDGHVWPEGPGGDQRWWAQFDCKTCKTFECLYETGNAQHGGERDPTGYF